MVPVPVARHTDAGSEVPVHRAATEVNGSSSAGLRHGRQAAGAPRAQAPAPV
jgi:hypothetical protein